MDEIEATIQLPRGARPLASYARYYAYVTPDEVMGEYMLPHLDDPPGQECEQIDPRFRGRTVPCSLPAREGKEIGAGKRAWLDDYHHMPMGNDDKCGALTFAFYTTAHRFGWVSCAGIAADLRPRPGDVQFFERPRVLMAVLNSHTPVPRVVLLGDQPGSTSPSFALYDDGTVIKASSGGFVTDKLTPEARDEFMRRINIGALRPLYGGFRIASSSDQPSEELLIYAGTKPVFISIYGSLADPLVRANVPPPILAAYATIKGVELPHARRWLPGRFPHEELWSSPNREVR